MSSLHLLLKEHILIQHMRQFIIKNINCNTKQINFSSNNRSKPNPSCNTSKQPRNSIMPQKDVISFQVWLDMYKSHGGEVPETINDKNLEILQQKFQQSASQTMKYLRFLIIKENMQKKDARNKIKKKEILKEKFLKFPLKETGNIIYKLWNNSMYGRVYKTTMNNLERHRLCNALQFGQPLIIDLGFDCHTLEKEISSLQRELYISIKDNMSHLNPFNLHICNLRDDKLAQIKEYIHILDDPTLPMNITSKSYLDLFPLDKLIYLSPDSQNVMAKFDDNAIYIIGGIVDLGKPVPLTLAKAESEGIKTMKLPLENYLDLKQMKPLLGIHIILAIMLELQTSGSFQKSFHYVPKRFLKFQDNKFGESMLDHESDLQSQVISRKHSMFKRGF